MWVWEIQICTQILHRGYRSCDIMHTQWRFALDRQFRAKYLENAWRYRLGSNGAPKSYKAAIIYLGYTKIAMTLQLVGAMLCLVIQKYNYAAGNIK